MTDALPILRLKKHEERRLRAGHLWVFSNEVDTQASPLTAFAPGDLVRVVSAREHDLGIATVHPHALICARILARDPTAVIDRDWLTARLRTALALRERLHASPHYRAVYGESDGLPGLVLDRFGDVVVGQIATAGMERLRPAIEAAVRAVLVPRTLVWKNDGGARDLEQLPHAVELAWGEMPAEVEVLEHGARFAAPLLEGQKTGWFYDQAANRARFAELLSRGARVLDVCSYVGAWGVAAARAGAAEVTCVDASARALEYAARNAAANGVQLQALRGDAFDVLAALADRGERFDAIVLDPPAFAKRRKDLPKAEAAYRKLNQLALRLVQGDGLLVSCSCSWHLAPESLIGAIQSAARHVSRFVQVIAIGGQAPDHPIHPAIPETRYLKAYFCRVTPE